ncbi:Peptidoglycan/LPS O-acetylase OafA/YrhL, contains acyltransferase and SGNH-hydrolase domains [Kaistia soli DSM 19436]|uniref:Peptidoglycan/LPS O-acetylase OafA/YrhL, contains acyltransferase and SGNH-hydrolase domains n=1 Tax=Kaistia soli DSM 19436 TaxID=1122133 RepID=A0A1M5D9W1_9HYPH|nr:acyltransferase [Kaistia soli]SHF63736.1 Peptidoglycan/LPS O-acetylase OafA/YrhL, contains acyltransferase and SGNH-hydrolase domains [Kaistia soli DSM 19436]
MPDERRRNIASLDLVRAASMAYLVGFWHLMNYVDGYPGYQNEVTTRFTVIVLATFTMLSGYLLGRRPLEPSLAAIGAFYRRRFLRVYPPLVVALIVFGALGIAGWTVVLKSVVLVSLFSGPSVWTIWYVCMIALFYLVAPILLVDRPMTLFGKRLAAWLWGGVLIWLGLLAVDASGWLAMEPRLALYFPCFIAGIGLARLAYDVGVTALVTAALLASVGVALTSGLPLPAIEMSLRSAPMAVFGGAFVMLAAVLLQHRIPSHPAVAVLGYAAFFMYLAHRPVYVVATGLFPLSAPAAQLAFMLLVALPCVIAISWLLQSLYDAALKRLGS